MAPVDGLARALAPAIDRSGRGHGQRPHRGRAAGRHGARGLAADPGRGRGCRAVHAGHAAAGARVVLTSTFGASPCARRRSSCGDGDVCRAAVAIARPRSRRRARGRRPRADWRAPGPYGDLEPAAARDAFAEQAAALAEAGVDLLWVETMADLAEARAAVEGARSAAPGVPSGRHPYLRAWPDALRRPTGGRRSGPRGAGSRGGRRELRVGLRGRPRRPGRACCRGARTAAHREGERGSADRRGRTARRSIPATAADAADYARRAAELGALIVGGCCGTTEPTSPRSPRSSRGLSAPWRAWSRREPGGGGAPGRRAVRRRGRRSRGRACGAARPGPPRGAPTEASPDERLERCPDGERAARAQQDEGDLVADGTPDRQERRKPAGVPQGGRSAGSRPSPRRRSSPPVRRRRPPPEARRAPGGEARYVPARRPIRRPETSQTPIANGSGGIWRPKSGFGMIAVTKPNTTRPATAATADQAR